MFQEDKYDNYHFKNNFLLNYPNAAESSALIILSCQGLRSDSFVSKIIAL